MALFGDRSVRRNLMGKIRVGILLLYLKLYDKVMPGLRNDFGDLIGGVESVLKDEGFSVEVSKICRTEAEFEDAIDSFEKKDTDVITTLHLAYSPSMEVIGPLAKTRLPIVVFDTTPKPDFSNGPTVEDVMQNHGIHGVQDMCNMLLREGIDFLITAGYWQDRKTIKELCKKIRAASAKSSLQKLRVCSIGGPFKGMGDFFVGDERLSNDLGVTIVDTDIKDITSLMPRAGESSISEEAQIDRERFIIGDVDQGSYMDTLRISLGLRRFIRQNNIGAFSMNFADLGKDCGFPTLPFLESSKLMSEGIGYAGEGDLLTACLVAALMRFEKDTSFVEMFCPDWKKDLIFLSHMGEMNIRLSAKKPELVCKELAFSELSDPVIAVGQFKQGKAVIADIAPTKKGYNLILSPVQVMDMANDIKDTITGWIKPEIPVKDFLEDYSRSGGTHHLALVYGDHLQPLMDFGQIMGFDIRVIGP